MCVVVVVCCIMSVICDKKGNEKMYKLKMLSTSLELNRKKDREKKVVDLKVRLREKQCCVIIAV